MPMRVICAHVTQTVASGCVPPAVKGRFSFASHTPKLAPPGYESVAAHFISMHGNVLNFSLPLWLFSLFLLMSQFVRAAHTELPHGKILSRICTVHNTPVSVFAFLRGYALVFECAECTE